MDKVTRFNVAGLVLHVISNGLVDGSVKQINTGGLPFQNVGLVFLALLDCVWVRYISSNVMSGLRDKSLRI